MRVPKNPFICVIRAVCRDLLLIILHIYYVLKIETPTRELLFGVIMSREVTLSLPTISTVIRLVERLHTACYIIITIITNFNHSWLRSTAIILETAVGVVVVRPWCCTLIHM